MKKEKKAVIRSIDPASKQQKPKLKRSAVTLPSSSRMLLYRSDGQAEAVTGEHRVGDGRVFEGIPNGCIIAVESSLKGLAEQVQK